MYKQIRKRWQTYLFDPNGATYLPRSLISYPGAPNPRDHVSLGTCLLSCRFVSLLSVKPGTWSKHVSQHWNFIALIWITIATMNSHMIVLFSMSAHGNQRSDVGYLLWLIKLSNCPRSASEDDTGLDWKSYFRHSRSAQFVNWIVLGDHEKCIFCTGCSPSHVAFFHEQGSNLTISVPSKLKVRKQATPLFVDGLVTASNRYKETQRLMVLRPMLYCYGPRSSCSKRCMRRVRHKCCHVYHYKEKDYYIQFLNSRSQSNAQPALMIMSRILYM